MLKGILFTCYKIYRRVYSSLNLCFWDTICKTYCIKNNVHFVDGIKHVLFNGHCHLSFANDACVSIGDNFICNSGIMFGGLVNDVSKMIVSKGASLSIGSNVGISSTVIFAKRSISIGNNVNVGGGINHRFKFS